MTRHLTRALIAAAVVTTLTACGGDGGSTVGAGPSATPSPTATATATAPAPTTSATASPAGTMLVPAYYLGDTHRGPRLYREFRTVPRSSGVVRAAVDTMLHTAPLDPDYHSLWPRATRVLGVSVSGDLATVDLSREARTASAGAEAEEMSVQQLVYTVTAAAPAVRRVQLRIEGATVETLWGHADVRRPVARRPQVDVVAAVWVIQPTYGASVGPTFAFSGDATVFEGTVSWDVRSCASATSCSTVLRKGFTTTAGAPARGNWSVTVTVPASVRNGALLEIRAWEDSAEDGTPLYRDTKIVTLRR